MKFLVLMSQNIFVAMLLQVLIIKGCHSIGEKRSVDMYGMVTYCGPVVAYGGPCTSVVSWSRLDVAQNRRLNGQVCSMSWH